MADNQAGKLLRLEIIAYCVLACTIAAGIVISRVNEDVFRNIFVVEDGLIEYITSVFLFCAAVLSFYRLFTQASGKGVWFIISTLSMGLLFFFGAGEEISWGQRIFGFETGDFFAENNAQKETNLHNLVVGGVKMNRLIFGKLLTVCLAIYFLIIPAVCKSKPSFRALFDRLYCPLPRYHHSIAFVLGGLAILLVESEKRGELNEFSLSILFILVISRPLNAEIYNQITRR